MTPNPLFQFALAVDQLFNTLFYHKKNNRYIFGYADEALSARAWRLRHNGWSWQYKFINALFFWQRNHCEEAYQSEKLRRQLPVEYRE